MREGNLKTREDVERVVRKMLAGRPDGRPTNHNRTYLDHRQPSDPAILP